MVSESDLDEFEAYCRTLTDRQVAEALEKEMTAFRYAYARVARAELRRRGIEPPDPGDDDQDDPMLDCFGDIHD
jgi:hypothetical protein